jgi:hypothetical protein
VNTCAHTSPINHRATFSAKSGLAQSAGNAGAFMNGFNKFLAATFLSASMLFTSAAQAMEIRQFDKMAVPDQSEYVGLLVQGAEQVLRDEGRADLANQVEHLFTTTLPHDAHTIGMVEFERNLAIMGANDAQHAIDHPNDPRLEVEDAMFATLDKNHIPLPDSFFAVNKDFKPKHTPPAKDEKKKEQKKKPN